MEPDSSPTSRRSRTALVIVVTLVVCLPVLAMAQYIAHVRTDELDTWLYASYGQQLAHGLTLYEQVWDNKPPGLYWVNAIGYVLGGRSLAGIIALCAAAAAGACTLTFLLARRLYDASTAGLVTLMMTVYAFLYPYHVGGNRPATFIMLTDLAALSLYVAAIAAPRPRWRWLVAAGACAGGSLLFKQTGLAVAIAVGVHHVYLAVSRTLSPRDAGQRLFAFAAGWVSLVALAIVLLAVTSDLRWAWHAIIAYNRELLSETPQWLTWFGQGKHQLLLALPVILAGATIVHPVVRAWWRDPRPPASAGDCQPPGFLVLLWAWLAAAVVLGLAGPYQRMAYWGIALPPLVLVAGHGVSIVLRSGRREGAPQPAFHIVVFALWMVYMMIAPVQAQVREFMRQRYYADAHPDPARQALVTAIRQYAGPDETIFVWEYNPKLLWLSDRPPAIRYFAATVAWQHGPAGQSLMTEICDSLERASPRVIVADPHRLSPAVGGGRVAPLDLGAFPEWLHSQYTRPDPQGLPSLWVRREQPPLRSPQEASIPAPHRNRGRIDG